MLTYLYYISILSCITYGYYLLQYVDRLHMRERGRYFGMYLYNLIGKKLIVSYIAKLLFKIFSQFLIIFDIMNGFIEGFYDMKPMVNLVKINDCNIQTDEIIPVEVVKIVTEIKEVPVIMPPDVNASEVLKEYKKVISIKEDDTSDIINKDKASKITVEQYRDRQKPKEIRVGKKSLTHTHDTTKSHEPFIKIKKNKHISNASPNIQESDQISHISYGASSTNRIVKK
jgi:hypothetical protein